MHTSRGVPGSGKHPHVRGEDAPCPSHTAPPLETPPRAWGGPIKFERPAAAQRNTPTCVGRTYFSGEEDTVSRKHPHVRGEDCTFCKDVLKHSETPPRAWGGQDPPPSSKMLPPNTPTCVGRTASRIPAVKLTGKHPHVRGEDANSIHKSVFALETPPRAWGGLKALLAALLWAGNTPTCVGRTDRQETPRRQGWKHPHVRGEDPDTCASPDTSAETPPRAWGGRTCARQHGAAGGNTPTCVGRTLNRSIPHG